MLLEGLQFTGFQWAVIVIGLLAVFLLVQIIKSVDALGQRIGAVENMIRMTAGDAENERRQIREDISAEVSAATHALEDISQRIEEIYPRQPEYPP
jgi:hypothetical protein